MGVVVMGAVASDAWWARAEIVGYSGRLGPHATDTVRYVVNDLFPDSGPEPGRRKGRVFAR